MKNSFQLIDEARELTQQARDIIKQVEDKLQPIVDEIIKSDDVSLLEEYADKMPSGYQRSRVLDRIAQLDIHYCGIGVYGHLMPNGYTLCDDLKPKQTTAEKNKVTCVECLKRLEDERWEKVRQLSREDKKIEAKKLVFEIRKSWE